MRRSTHMWGNVDAQSLCDYVLTCAALHCQNGVSASKASMWKFNWGRKQTWKTLTQILIDQSAGAHKEGGHYMIRFHCVEHGVEWRRSHFQRRLELEKLERQRPWGAQVDVTPSTRRPSIPGGTLLLEPLQEENLSLHQSGHLLPVPEKATNGINRLRGSLLEGAGQWRRHAGELGRLSQAGTQHWGIRPEPGLGHGSPVSANLCGLARWL